MIVQGRAAEIPETVLAKDRRIGAELAFVESSGGSYDLLSGAIVFDEAKTVLPMKIFLHRRFHSLDTTMVEVGESNDMAKHRAIRVNPSGVVLEIDSTEIGGT